MPCRNGAPARRGGCRGRTSTVASACQILPRSPACPACICSAVPRGDRRPAARISPASAHRTRQIAALEYRNVAPRSRRPPLPSARRRTSPARAPVNDWLVSRRGGCAPARTCCLRFKAFRKGIGFVREQPETAESRPAGVKHAKIGNIMVFAKYVDVRLRCCRCKRLRPRLEASPLPGIRAYSGPSSPPRRTAPLLVSQHRDRQDPGIEQSEGTSRLSLRAGQLST